MTEFKGRPKLVANPKPNNSLLKQLNAHNRAVLNTYASYSEIPKEEVFQMGKQTSDAELCTCGRGTANPFTGICSTCKIEAQYKGNKHGVRMKGI